MPNAISKMLTPQSPAPIVLAFLYRALDCSREIPEAFALGRKHTTINPMRPNVSNHLDPANPFFSATIMEGMPNKSNAKYISYSWYSHTERQAGIQTVPGCTLSAKLPPTQEFFSVLFDPRGRRCSRSLHSSPTLSRVDYS